YAEGREPLERLARETAPEGALGHNLFVRLALPSAHRTYLAGLRLERQAAALRVVEAGGLHAPAPRGGPPAAPAPVQAAAPPPCRGTRSPAPRPRRGTGPTATAPFWRCPQCPAGPAGRADATNSGPPNDTDERRTTLRRLCRPGVNPGPRRGRSPVNGTQH